MHKQVKSCNKPVVAAAGVGSSARGLRAFIDFPRDSADVLRRQLVSRKY